MLMNRSCVYSGEQEYAKPFLEALEARGVRHWVQKPLLTRIFRDNGTIFSRVPLQNTGFKVYFGPSPEIRILVRTGDLAEARRLMREQLGETADTSQFR